MTQYQPIDCYLHDYLEIACMFLYRLRIELTDGSCFDGKAISTCTTANKEEYLRVEIEQSCREIRLDRLSAITPLMAEAVFDRIVFSTQTNGK